MKSSDLLRKLPSVSELLNHPQVKSVVDRLNHSVATTRVRGFLDELRTELTNRAEHLPLPSVREIIDRVTRYVAQDDGWRCLGAINATGQFGSGPWVSLPLTDDAVERTILLSKDFAVADAESDPTVDAVQTLKQLTGAEGAAVFHTRAGALMLILGELAKQPPVVIARGEMGEAAPGCRVTDLCQAAGAQFVEVGSTDSVTVADYAEALQAAEADSAGGVLLRLAPSRAPAGAASRPATSALAGLARERCAVLVEDLAAGPLVDLPSAGVGIAGIDAPSAAGALADGADLVLVRGDGLVGGPACCLALGRRELIDRLKANRLAPLHQPTAATAVAIAATLKLLSDPEQAILKTPLLSLLSTPLENLRTRAERLAPQIAESPLVATSEAIEIPAATSPPAGLPYRAASYGVAITPAAGDADSLAETLREGSPGLWGRVEAGMTGDAGRLVLDLRSVFPRQDLAILAAFPVESDDSPTTPPAAAPGPTG